MKILIISDAWYPQVNGVVRTYEHLSEELIKMGHQVHVIGPSDFPYRLPLFWYPEIKLAIAPYGRLKKMIDQYAPDHIHIATEGPLGWAARKYVLKHKSDFSTCYHTHFPDYVARRFARPSTIFYDLLHKGARAYVKKFHAQSRALMVATKSLEDDLKSWGFKMPMYRLTRGVNLDMFYPGEKTLFKNLKGPIALYVGRIAVEKSVQDFLRMKWPGSKIIVGDGPSLIALSRRYPKVHFVGRKFGEELAAHYRSADLFVFPSRTDTFGIVLIEALASGLPIAAYNVTGPKDIVTLPFLGALDDDLASAADKALHTGAPQQRSDYARETYSWEHAAKQFEAAIKPQ